MQEQRGSARRRETRQPALFSPLSQMKRGNFLLRNNQDIPAQTSEDPHVSTNIPEDQTDNAVL